MSLRVNSLALSAISSLRVATLAIKRHDRCLSQQLRNALSSVALNIAEAEYSDPGTKRSRLHYAAGSANEARSALTVALAWHYVSETDVATGLANLDQVIAVLYRLLHPRR